MKVFIFDTETTDLISNTLLPEKQQPRIIEFFGHLVDDQTGEKFTEVDFICNPGIKIPEKSASITGITDHMVANEPPFKNFLPRIMGAMKNAEAVVAHNLSFDMAVCDIEFARCGEAVNWPDLRFCTVESTEWVKGHRLNLSSLHEVLFGEKFEGAHRARADVEALTRCWFEIRNRGWA